jgi:lipoprotein-releasing system permease protein
MRFSRFEFSLATRHLLKGGGQTVLTIAAVASGVVVIIFISSIIFGVRKHISELLTDLLPHIQIQVHEPVAHPLGGANTFSKIEPVQQRELNIEDWERVMAVVKGLPNVVSVAPAIYDRAFVTRGGKQVGVLVNGADPEALDSVTRIRKYIIEGRYFGMAVGECVVNYKMVKEIGLRLGDHIRVTSPTGTTQSFRVVGIYDTGSDEDTYRMYITLRAAQSLYGTGKAVRTLLVKTTSLDDADQVADRIMAVTKYDAKSWSREYPQFQSSLGVYNAVAYLVSIFSLIASAFAIASVLIVSVLQKGKQIGILKSIGAKSKQIFSVFLLEGLGISIIGASVGGALGVGLVQFLTIFKQPVNRPGAVPENLFPSQLSPGLVGVAMLGAILATIFAAALPARRAARMDPAEVMK